jgi:phage tail-like protein
MAEIKLPALVVDVAVGQDADRPAIINRDPAPDEIGAPRAGAIRFELIDVLDPYDGIDPSTLEVWIEGDLAWVNGAAADGFSGSWLSAGDTLYFSITPDEPFSSEQVVTVRVVCATEDAQELDVTWSFTVEDFTAPKLIAAQGWAQKVVRLVFDDEVVVTDPLGFSFEALGAPAVPIVAVGAVAAGAAIDVELDTEMTPDVEYRVTAAGVSDTDDNEIVAPDDIAVFAGFRPARPAARRFSLWLMLPRMNRRQDDSGSGDLRRFIDCCQEVVDLLLAEYDRFVDVYDIDRAPAPFVEMILADLGNPFTSFNLGEADQRRLAGVLMEIYKQKGTAAGIVNAVRFFLGLEVEVAHLRRTTLVLGVSELGVDWELGSGDRRVLYSFTVESPELLSAAQRQQIEVIANYMKPAHTHLVRLIEPEDPEAVDHWELGTSRLGDTTDLH